jgi:succinate dehydrogenase flavin-adding protein (antitoxin of CptAB toxin-antitoxin module)
MQEGQNMDINNKARIHWACRRGMRELDISIMPFFEYEYDTLSDDDKRCLFACWKTTIRIYSTG